jgi:hypothetical protein
MSKRVFGQDNYDTREERAIDFPREPSEPMNFYPVIRARPNPCHCGHVKSLHLANGRCMACQCTDLRVSTVTA